MHRKTQMPERRTKSVILDPGTPIPPLLGKLLHDLGAASSAKRGRWATIEVWEPDPAASPIRDPVPEDVLAITGVGASSFQVAGDYTEELHDEFPILIRDSTPNGDGVSNDGLYALDGEPTFASGTTTITIQGVLPDAAITDGELVIVRPTVLKSTGRKATIVNRSSVTATEGTFVKATPTGFEWLIDVINCVVEEDEE